MYLSVIIPAYNEEKRLPKTLRALDQYLREQSYEYEIIVVSDGSKDNTAGVVRNMQSEIANVRLIDNKENHGKGYVVRQGMTEAKGQYRLFTDADNSTSIDQVEKMFPHFQQGYDIVIGSRDVKGAVLAPPQPWPRRKRDVRSTMAPGSPVSRSGRHSMRRDLLNEVRMRGSVSLMARGGGSLWDRFIELILQRNPPRASHFYPVG